MRRHTWAFYCKRTQNSWALTFSQSTAESIQRRENWKVATSTCISKVMDEHRKKLDFFKNSKERELFLLCKAKLGLNIGWPCVWAPLVMRKEGLLERRRNSSKALEKGKNPTNVTSAKSRDEYQGRAFFLHLFLSVADKKRENGKSNLKRVIKSQGNFHILYFYGQFSLICDFCL